MIVEPSGIFPALKYTSRGTEAEILAATPSATQIVEAYTTDTTPRRKYDWMGTQWRLDSSTAGDPGSPSNPFADISELEEHFTANPPQYLGQYAFVDNGANPPKPYRWHGGAPTNWVEEAGGGAPAAVDWVDLT